MWKGNFSTKMWHFRQNYWCCEWLKPPYAVLPHFPWSTQALEAFWQQFVVLILCFLPASSLSTFAITLSFPCVAFPRGLCRDSWFLPQPFFYLSLRLHTPTRDHNFKRAKERERRIKCRLALLQKGNPCSSKQEAHCTVLAQLPFSQTSDRQEDPTHGIAEACDPCAN